MSSHIINSFAARATASPYAISLGLGLGAISYYFWGNVAAQSMGAIVLSIYPEERKKVGIDTSKAVEIWGWGYKQGAKHMGISGAVAGLAVLAAAFQATPAKFLFSPRNYLLLLSPLLLANGIYTVVFMLPTNNGILAIRDRIVKARSVADSSSSSPLSIAQEEEAKSLLQKWKKLHYVRIALGAVGWAGTLAVYMATV